MAGFHFSWSNFGLSANFVQPLIVSKCKSTFPFNHSTYNNMHKQYSTGQVAQAPTQWHF